MNPSRIGPALIVALGVSLAVLHQDFWLWGNRTLLFGWMPIGLAYHAGFSVAAGLLWALCIRLAWPAELEAWADSGQKDDDEIPPDGDTTRSDNHLPAQTALGEDTEPDIAPPASSGVGMDTASDIQDFLVSPGAAMAKSAVLAQLSSHRPGNASDTHPDRRPPASSGMGTVTSVEDRGKTRQLPVVRDARPAGTDPDETNADPTAKDADRTAADKKRADEGGTHG